VDHSLGVRGAERGEQLVQDRDDFNLQHRPVLGDHLVERHALQVLHHQVLADVRNGAKTEDVDDPPVADRTGRACLGDQISRPVAIGELGPQDLDGHLAANDGVLALVDDAHAARADAALDDEVSQLLAHHHVARHRRFPGALARLLRRLDRGGRQQGLGGNGRERPAAGGRPGRVATNGGLVDEGVVRNGACAIFGAHGLTWRQHGSALGALQQAAHWLIHRLPTPTSACGARADRGWRPTGLEPPCNRLNTCDEYRTTQSAVPTGEGARSVRHRPENRGLNGRSVPVTMAVEATRRGV
jgi:hypothetical protein